MTRDIVAGCRRGLTIPYDIEGIGHTTFGSLGGAAHADSAPDSPDPARNRATTMASSSIYCQPGGDMRSGDCIRLSSPQSWRRGSATTRGEGDLVCAVAGVRRSEGLTQRDRQSAIEFSFDGSDEGDRINGRGWAVLENDALHGRFFIHHGDESSFVARRAATVGAVPPAGR